MPAPELDRQASGVFAPSSPSGAQADAIRFVRTHVLTVRSAWLVNGVLYDRIMKIDEG